MSSTTARLSFAVAALALAALPSACSRQQDAQQEAQQPAPPAAESSTGPAAENPDVHRFAIGELSAMALRDGGLEVPNDNKVLGVGRTPEEVAALLTAAGLPADKLSLSIQPLLVAAADRVLLFDTGAGAVMGPGGGRLPASLAAAGVDPGSVTDIFISHSHGDHIGGLVNAQGALAFPNATIHMSAPEWKFMSAKREGSPAGMDALVTAITPKVQAFAPGAEIVPGTVKAVEIRGHTPGHSGYLITSGDSSLLYIGDTMHHFVVSVQRPDWTIAFDGEAPTAEASRNALLERSAADRQLIYAVHFPFPGIGRIERRDAGFGWAPATP